MSDSPKPTERRRALALLAVSLSLGGAIRAWLALHDDGIYWPDEVYQSLEPAHRLVFGYGMIAWEFVEGARNWALPGLVAFVLKACDVLGLDHPRQYLGVTKLVFAALSLGCAWGSYQLARAYGAERLFAAAGAALCSLLAPFVYFAPRAMSENAAALPVVLGLALALSPGAGRRRTLVGASLLGLSVLLRLQCGVFAVALVAILFARRQPKRALEALGALSVFALLFGLLDALTWADAPGARFGGWFHSAVKYLEFNLVEGKASGWGTSPWHYYFTTLTRAAPPAVLLGTALALAAARRAPGLSVTTLVFVGLHALIPHKELRFLLPAIPLFCALAAVGLSALPRELSRPVGAPLLVAFAALSGATYHRLTFGQVGQYPERPHESAYDDFGPVNRLLLAAHDRPTVCGVRIDVAHLAWTGGHSYLHRRAPLFHQGQPPLELGLVSHVITHAQAQLPGEVVARQGGLVLVELPVRECTEAAGYAWRLP